MWDKNDATIFYRYSRNINYKTRYKFIIWKVRFFKSN